MQQEKLKIYLAALIHDIGKFYQRADSGSSRNSDYLKQEVLNCESTFCPKHPKGEYYTHKHVLWTAQFLVDHSEVFLNISHREGINELTGKDTLIRLASNHHKPSSDLEKLIQRADHLASGVDRTQKEGLADAEYEHKWDDYKRIRMRSIFESLLRKSHQHEYILPISGQQLDKNYFPFAGDLLQDTKPYKELWDRFTEELKKIRPDTLKSFSDTLLNLLEKYTSTIPSSTQHLTDVSLFDHLKMTAGIAICLYDHQKSNPRAENELLMIGGDISGIQSYIYDIISKYAAKNLKGRSFYIQLLVDSVIQRIIDKLNLTKSNIIYASGGGFYLLAPNTKDVKDELIKLEEELGQALWKTHKTSLFLALDAIELSGDHDLLRRNLGDKWKELIEKLNIKKRRRFKSQILNQYDSFFQPQEQGGEALRDAITGEEISDNQNYPIETRNSNNERISWQTKNQIDLGKDLRSSDYWITSSRQIDYLSKVEINPCELNVYHYFLNRDRVANLTDQLRGSADYVTVQTFNDLDFLKNDIKGNHNSYGYTFYGGNKYPVTPKGDPKTFEELTGRSNNENNLEGNFHRLGILRMDVDGLGQIFIKGFDEEKRTFSRYSALSRGLDYFFKGYLNHIWKTEEFTTHSGSKAPEPKVSLKEYTQILYAGGDDLFIVGRWDACIHFAECIQQSFQEWTCYNPNISISGGIAIVPVKFPISMGADMAAEAEKAAKNHTYYLNKDKMPKEILEKNAFTLLGMPLNWKYEYPIVKELKDNMATWLASGQVTKSLLSKIRIHHDAYQNQVSKDKNEAWRWNMAYDFARFAKSNGEISEDLHEIKNAAFTERYKDHHTQGNRPFIELLNLAARWAELEYRNS